MCFLLLPIFYELFSILKHIKGKNVCKSYILEYICVAYF